VHDVLCHDVWHADGCLDMVSLEEASVSVSVSVSVSAATMAAGHVNHV